MNVKVKPNQAHRSAGVSQQTVYQQKQNGSGHKGILIAVAVALAAALLIVLGTWLYQSQDSPVATGGGEINKDQYQAVFLTNGQVYFGKLSKPNSNYVNLEDIYYLQIQQSTEQPSSERPAVQPSSENQQSQVSLTKLGKELHGPEDKMYIARDQVLFWENLKSDSTVSKAIKENESKN